MVLAETDNKETLMLLKNKDFLWISSLFSTRLDNKPEGGVLSRCQ